MGISVGGEKLLVNAAIVYFPDAIVPNPGKESQRQRLKNGSTPDGIRGCILPFNRAIALRIFGSIVVEVRIICPNSCGHGYDE